MDTTGTTEHGGTPTGFAAQAIAEWYRARIFGTLRWKNACLRSSYLLSSVIALSNCPMKRNRLNLKTFEARGTRVLRTPMRRKLPLRRGAMLQFPLVREFPSLMPRESIMGHFPSYNGLPLMGIPLSTTTRSNPRVVLLAPQSRSARLLSQAQGMTRASVLGIYFRQWETVHILNWNLNL